MSLENETYAVGMPGMFGTGSMAYAGPLPCARIKHLRRVHVRGNFRFERIRTAAEG